MRGYVKSLIGDLLMRIFLLLCFITVAFYACHPINEYFGMPDDNIAEELSEAAIKYETGLDIDLTPNSPEK